MKSACSKILIAILIRVNFERKERGETETLAKRRRRGEARDEGRLWALLQIMKRR
jgi:hypothetical protein